MKDLQSEIKQFCKDNSMEAPIEHRVLDLMSELGEVSKEILKMSSYGTKPLGESKELEGELGDALYSLVTVANYFDINLEEAVKGALAKYKRRLQKGSAGSESD